MAHFRANLQSRAGVFTCCHGSHRLYAQGHDTVDNVVVVLLEGLDGLLPRNAGLLHDELDVLGLKARVVNLLIVILLLLLVLLVLDSLALALAGLVAVVVAGVVVGCGLGLSKLLGGGSLSLGVEVLDLGLTEDAGAGSAKVAWAMEGQLLTSRCCLKGTCRRRAG